MSEKDEMKSFIQEIIVSSLSSLCPKLASGQQKESNSVVRSYNTGDESRRHTYCPEDVQPCPTDVSECPEWTRKSSITCNTRP